MRREDTMIGRIFARMVCCGLDRHAPRAPIKRGELGFYAQCSHCGEVITKSGLTAWKTDRSIDPGSLSAMRKVC